MLRAATLDRPSGSALGDQLGIRAWQLTDTVVGSDDRRARGGSSYLVVVPGGPYQVGGGDPGGVCPPATAGCRRG